MIRVLALLSLASLSRAFVAHQQRVGVGAPVSASSLAMAPRFDVSVQKWVPTKPEEEASAGYPAFKTLLLRGPKPFLHRVLQPDDYEQAVLKFMAGDGVDRETAQGNMDAYLENPNDWAFNRFEDQKRGVVRNYTTIDSTQLTLTLIWSVIVFFMIGRTVVSFSYETPFWSFLPWVN